MDRSSKDEISINELISKLIIELRSLKRQRNVILLAGIIGGLLGFWYSYNKKPTFTAQLTFALEEKSNTGGLNSIASSFGLNIGVGDGGAFAGDNIIELMKSRLMIEKTLLTEAVINNKKDLIINRYISFNKLRDDWSKNTELNNIDFVINNRELYTRVQDSILGSIQETILKDLLEVSKIDKKLSIISVKFNSTDEEFAKIFCENLVKNVVDFYVETKVGKSKKNVLLLESRVDSVKRELDQAMYGRASFADQNMSLIRQSAAVPKLKQEMRVQMLSTMYGELVKNLEFSKLTLMRDEPLIQIIDKPIMPLLSKKTSITKSIILGFITSIFFTISFLFIKKLFQNFY